MNPEQDQFRDLRRLLALKRHEQPPPRYFNEFSQQVILRIKAGERVDSYSALEVLSWEAPWLQRCLSLLESRPLLAGGFGAAVCVLLLTGILASETREANFASPGGFGAGQQSALIANTPAATPEIIPVSGSWSNAADLAQPGNSLFDQLKGYQSPGVMRVSAPGSN